MKKNVDVPAGTETANDSTNATATNKNVFNDVRLFIEKLQEDLTAPKKFNFESGIDKNQQQEKAPIVWRLAQEGYKLIAILLAERIENSIDNGKLTAEEAEGIVSKGSRMVALMGKYWQHRELAKQIKELAENEGIDLQDTDNLREKYKEELDFSRSTTTALYAYNYYLQQSRHVPAGKMVFITIDGVTHQIGEKLFKELKEQHAGNKAALKDAVKAAAKPIKSNEELDF